MTFSLCNYLLCFCVECLIIGRVRIGAKKILCSLFKTSFQAFWPVKGRQILCTFAEQIFRRFKLHSFLHSFVCSSILFVLCQSQPSLSNARQDFIHTCTSIVSLMSSSSLSLRFLVSLSRYNKHPSSGFTFATFTLFFFLLSEGNIQCSCLSAFVFHSWSVFLSIFKFRPFSD